MFRRVSRIFATYRGVADRHVGEVCPDCNRMVHNL